GVRDARDSSAQQSLRETIGCPIRVHFRAELTRLFDEALVAENVLHVTLDRVVVRVVGVRPGGLLFRLLARLAQVFREALRKLIAACLSVPPEGPSAYQCLKEQVLEARRRRAPLVQRFDMTLRELLPSP